MALRNRKSRACAVLLASRRSKSVFICVFIAVSLFLILITLSEYLQAILHLRDTVAVRTFISANDSRVLDHSFTNLFDAYNMWDKEPGCDRFRHRQEEFGGAINPSLQAAMFDGSFCAHQQIKHVSILVKKWKWLPGNLENLYVCGCGLSCLWTSSEVLVGGTADVELYETATPPYKRKKGEPLRAYMDLEPGRKLTGYEDIFISYHAGDTVQATYAGSSFHTHRSYFTSSTKRNDVLVYWSSSNCVPARMLLAKKILSYLPHHSFGKCLNNMGRGNAILKMYPECGKSSGDENYWAYHLHCAMSHYKFVLAIENTRTESYVTEKLFYALDAGAVPIYFGAENVWDMVPPHSIIDGSEFSTLESLVSYVKKVAADPVLYAEYHAWRRCGVMGNYHQARAVSLDSLPCRLCSVVSKYGGRDYQGR